MRLPNGASVFDTFTRYHKTADSVVEWTCRVHPNPRGTLFTGSANHCISQATFSSTREATAADARTAADKHVFAHEHRCGDHRALEHRRS